MSKLIELLQAALAEAQAAPAPEIAEPGVITDDMVAQNVFGVNRADLRNVPDHEFQKLRKYYNESKEPWHGQPSEWMITMGTIGADRRRNKRVMVNGVMAWPVTKQHGAPWTYWVRRGYIKDDQGNWYQKVK